jgi:hypothetical protein
MPVCSAHRHGRVGIVKVTILLADYAQASEGKLNVIGGGWQTTGPLPTPSALAILIEVPWDRTNEKHHVRIELVDADGTPVVAEDPVGDEAPVVLEADFEVGRPPGTKRGTPIAVPLAINMGPQPLAPNSRYEWKLSINGEGDEDWRVAFSTRPESPGQ